MNLMKRMPRKHRQRLKLLPVIGLLCYFLHSIVTSFDNADDEKEEDRGPDDVLIVTEEPRYCNVFPVSAPIEDTSKCVRLQALPLKPLLCLHDPRKDRFISARLLAGKMWEEQSVRTFLHVLRSHPTAGVLDIGANIGVYTVLAAALGRNVVAVEARLKHVRMLHRSLKLNVMRNRVVGPSCA